MKSTTSRWGRVAVLAFLALTTVACGDDDNEVTVTAHDYRFEDLPRTVDAGTTFSLTNASNVELHEMVAVRLPEGETRSADELVRLPEDQLMLLFAGEPAFVLLAPPGDGDQITAVGDGTLRQTGRYLIICAIPVGADPQAVLEAAQQGGEGPPDVAGGPPHFTQGMYGEVTVE